MNAALFCLVFLISVRTSSGNITDKLKKHHFRVSATPVQGYLAVEKGPDGNYTFVGVTKDYYDVMFDSYRFVLVNASEAAAVGITQASIEQLLRGEVDISSLGFAATVERLRFMDFGFPVSIEEYALLVPYPREESRLWGPIRPFQSTVWKVFLASFCSVVVALSLLHPNFIWKTASFWSLLSDNTTYITSVLISNAEQYRSNGLVMRLMIGFFVLMSVIFINSYTGNLTAYLTVPALKPIPNTYEQLAARKDLSVIVDDKSVVAEQFLKATSGALKELGDSLRKHPDHLFRTVQKGEQLLFTLKTVYPGIIYISKFLIGRYLKLHGTCGLTLSKPIPHFLKSSPGLPKNGEFNAAINMKIHYLTEMGLLGHLKRKYSPRVQKCLLENREKPKTSRLNLNALASAFVALGIGMAISISTFLLELVVGRMKST